MTIKAGYWVDLTTVQLGEQSTGTWIQALPIGTWTHPLHGEIKITPERAQRFADNVNKNVRGQDLNIDYDHVEGVAAGWVKGAKADAVNGCQLLVEWTQEAFDKIKNKAYRYFSPEFVDEWTNPSSNTKFSDVLFGGGLTNRPFLKGIMPINMSEMFDVSPHKESQVPEGGSKVTPEQIKAAATKLGLGDDATEEDVFGAIQTLEIVPDETPAPAPEPLPIAASEQLKQLSESNPAVKQLLDAMTSQSTQLSEVQAALHLSEVDGQVIKLAEYARSKGVAIAPATQDALKTELLKLQGHKQLSETVRDAFTAMVDMQVVQLGERGKALLGTPEAPDGVKKFSEKVGEVMKANDKLSYAEAVSHVSQTEPQLYEDYRAASYANQGGVS